MTEVLFHHYPQSPVSEKVRAVFGIKKLSWRSVEIPWIPPKPDLMPLTGGYRRTPVMQIGADIYCDSCCIIHELEHRFPNPTLFPGSSNGLDWGLSRWTDGELFLLCVGVVLGSGPTQLPPDFAADRGRLYFGSNFNLESEALALPYKLAQLRTHFGWADERLAESGDFMLGDQPGLADALLHHVVWFLHGRYSGGPELLDEFHHLVAWEQRMLALGHGSVTELSSQDALAIARTATTKTSVQTDANDPQRFAPGANVQVRPDGDGGDPWVLGQLRVLTRDVIALDRIDPAVGEITVHFPRIGYRIEAA